MPELFSPLGNTPTNAPTIKGGRILIVDDDPIVSGMLAVSLEAAGHQTSELPSGEAAIAALTDASTDNAPDVVFLDIEMAGGIDGYEACRRLRTLVGFRALPVIFLSGHDLLEDRIQAYDAGGSDFMAKPFSPDEVLRKAALAISYIQHQRETEGEGKASFSTAMTAMTTLGESGVTLNFSRGALGCRTQQALATLTIESMASFGVHCHVQLRTPTETLTLTPRGLASPLEESVIEKLRSMGRLFSFHNRSIVNFEHISILISDMPVANDELCGRIRDHVAMIAEAAELAVGNIHLRTESIQRAELLRKLSADSSQAVESLRVGYRDLQIATRFELDNMTNDIETMYISLGLTDDQENALSNTVRNSVERALSLFERGIELDKNFSGIIEGLAKAGETTATIDEAPSSDVELW